MTDYFRGKTLVCEQTKPRTYFTPIFQRIGDSLKLHHMEADCLSYQHSKKMLPVEHMGKHKRRIFELEDENAKLRELVQEAVDAASLRDITDWPYGQRLGLVERARELGVEPENDAH